MRKRQIALLIGMIGLGLAGCQKQPAEPASIISSEETQESSLEETLEAVLESGAEEEPETESETEPETEPETESVTEPSTVIDDFEEGWQETGKGKRYLIGDDRYYTSTTRMIDGKLYYFNDEGYTVPDGASPEGRKLGAVGEYVFEDLVLGEVPNKSQIDKALEDNYSTYANGYMGLEFNSEPFTHASWIDCGDYYRMDNVSLVVFTDDVDLGGLEEDELAKLDYICIRKDGVFIFDRRCFTIDEWIEKFGCAPRWGVMFDEKGYIVSWYDLGVC